MAHYNLEHSYNKFSGKKFKDSLSSFLPNLPGMIDTPGNLDNSSIRSVIDKPPIGGKELVFLNNFQLSGFRLHPGPVINADTLQLIKTKHSVLIIHSSSRRCTEQLQWPLRRRSRNTRNTKRAMNSPHRKYRQESLPAAVPTQVEE